MAGPTETPSAPERVGVLDRMPLHRRIQFWLFAGLVVLAAVFYLWWGLSYGVWVDNGVYAVAIVLLMFGLSGMWLSLPNPPAPAPP